MAEDAVLGFLKDNKEISDSGTFSSDRGISHEEIVNVIQSLKFSLFVETKDIKREKWVLTDEGKMYAEEGSPEAQLFAAVPPEGITWEELQKKVKPSIYQIGCQQAVKNKWIEVMKSQVSKKVQHVDDRVKDMLIKIRTDEAINTEDIKGLKRRKLITSQIWKGYSVTKGPKYEQKREKVATDLTLENLQRGDWQEMKFECNQLAKGQQPEGGCYHPLVKVKLQIQMIFHQMGFEEMPTNCYVDSSFWNFDALFQPQDHPARDSHDTFFLKEPSTPRMLPEDYVERVKKVHESGGYKSKGYGYDWKRDEANKTLLRTHTTAVSSRILYKLGQQETFTPKKYYSINRVYRNGALDRTHLAEFHQIEGVMCNRGLTLRNLKRVLREFFSGIGMSKLKFKAAYNPYTEPSMEIFSYHEGLSKWIEIGNSGMFRPEMLRPMGLPEDVKVIAFGLSLERPTMILYGIDNIRDLFGYKVDLQLIKKNPICDFGV